MFNQTIRLISCLCVPLIFGCVYSTEPLCTEEDAEVDTKLVGTWREHQGSATTYVISANERDKTLTVLVKEDPPMVIRTTQIGKNGFLSYDSAFDSSERKSDKPETEEPRVAATIKWESARYKFASDDEITIFAFDEKKVAAAIKSGDLKGEVTYRQPLQLFARKKMDPVVDDVRITSTRAELRKYLTDHPDDCIDLKSPFLVLKRVVDRKKK